MPAEKPPYHHGDLRAQLIETAMAHVETDGPGKLSLRKLAAQAGVSHNAPYMHFPSKDALLDAVVAQGFADLRARLAQAGGQDRLTSADWSDRVRQGFRAYVAFARDRPGLYALMHVPRGGAPAGSDAEGTAADQAGAGTLDGLAATLEAGQRLGRVRAGDTGEMALWVWATLHGLAVLTSENRLAFDGRAPDRVTDAVLDHLVRSLAD